MKQRLPIWLLAVAGLLSPAALADDEKRPVTLESLEDREITIEQSQAEPVDDQTALENYRRLLELSNDPAQKAIIKRRLADLELELAADADDPTAGAERALALYDELLASGNAPPGQRDDLLYQKARAADQANQQENAIQALTQLIEQHPDSPLVAEARFRRAEMLFVGRDFAAAEQDYAWLARNGQETPFITQALYKHGWSLYRLSRNLGSLEAFTGVLRRIIGEGQLGPQGQLDLSGISRADQELVNDSLRGITLNLAQLGDDLPPGQYIDNQNAQAFEYLVFNNLLAYYQEQQRFTDASNTALAFAERNPEHPEAKRFEVAAITALEDGGFPSLALERKQDYVRRYGIEKQSWYGEDPLTVPEVRERLTDYLNEITRSFHAAAQESGDAGDYERAAEWYATYLEAFPDSERAPELAFLRGDVLLEAGRASAAAEQYEQVAYGMGDNPKAEEAGYAALLAWRKAASQTGNDIGRSQVREATLRFAEQYPNHPQADAALMRLAEDYYAADELEAASEIAQQIIQHQPGASQARLRSAWQIRAAVAEKSGNYEEAETALSWLLDGAPADKRPALRERLAAAIYKQGEALVEAGKDTAAAEQFLRIQQAVPVRGEAASDIRSTALYDAAQANIRAGNKDEAVRLLETFRDQYPQNELMPEATRKLAALYLELDRKAEAAEAFARIRQHSDIDAATRQEAALETARLYAETGRRAAAIEAYKIYIREHQPPFDSTVEAQHRLVELHSEAGEPDKADFWRNELIETHADAGANATDRSRTLAADASLDLADAKRARFYAVQLTPPVQKSLKTKKERLEAALDAYGEAADYGIAEVTSAATFRIGELYYDFSRALLNSPAPNDLSGEELAQYEILLEEQAFPFEEQAIDIHEANVERISEGVYNQWIDKSLTQLGKLLPVRYAKQERLSDELQTP